MYTMDYVSHVLSLQGWERCDCINDYMTGSEPTSDVIECSSQYLMKKTQNFLHRVSQPAESRETACQTPSDWSTLEAAPSAQEAEPRRALDRIRTLDAGMSPPKPFFRASLEGW